MSTDLLPTLPDLANQINAAHKLCEAALKNGLQHAMEAGRLLAEVKSLCPHGEWLPWLKSNFKGSPRTAQGYMRIASHWPELEANTQHVSHLPYRQALALLAAPEPPSLDNWTTQETDWIIENTPAIQAAMDKRLEEAKASLPQLRQQLEHLDETANQADGVRVLAAIIRECTTVQNRIARDKLDSERFLGRLLLENPWLEEVMTTPGGLEAFREACDRRIADLAAPTP